MIKNGLKQTIKKLLDTDCKTICSISFCLTHNICFNDLTPSKQSHKLSSKCVRIKIDFTYQHSTVQQVRNTSMLESILTMINKY